VRHAEVFAGQAVQEFAGDRFARCEADGVDETVQPVPGFGQVGEQVGNLLVAGDVAVEYQLAAEFGGKFSDAVFEALANVGESQFGAFAVGSLGDAVSDGTVGQDASNEDFFCLARKPYLLQWGYTARPRL
jgi:hypothetical protein